MFSSLRDRRSSLMSHSLLKKFSLDGDVNLGNDVISAIDRIITENGAEVLDLSRCRLSAAQLQTLTDSTKSAAKLRSLVLWGNRNLGIDGMSAVGRIATRNDVEKLNLSYCNLSAKQLQTLADSTKYATKLRSLVLWGNENMGIDGISTVGRIVTRNDVEELILSDCRFSAEHLQTLADSTRDATNLQVVDLSAEVIYDEKHGMNFEHQKIRAVQNLISNVTAGVRLCGYQISYEDVACLQNELDKLGKEGLRVQIGKRHENKYLSAKYQVGVPSNVQYPAAPFAIEEEEQDVKADFSAATEDVKPSARKSTSEYLKEDEGARISDDGESMSDVEVPARGSTSTAVEKSERTKRWESSEISMGTTSFEEGSGLTFALMEELEFGFHTQETEKEIRPDGGLIKVDECSLYFPPHSFVETRVIKMSISMDFRNLNLPEELLQISPLIGIKFRGNLNIPATLTLTSWFQAPRNDIIRIYKRKSTNSTWCKLENEVKVTDGRIEFQIDHFCVFVATVRKGCLGSGYITLSHALLHQGRTFESVVCYANPESLIQQKISLLREQGRKLERVERVIIKSSHYERIPVTVESLLPDLYQFQPTQRDISLAEIKTSGRNSRCLTFLLYHLQPPRTRDVDIRYIVGENDFGYAVEFSSQVNSERQQAPDANTERQSTSRGVNLPVDVRVENYVASDHSKLAERDNRIRHQAEFSLNRFLMVLISVLIAIIAILAILLLQK